MERLSRRQYRLPNCPLVRPSVHCILLLRPATKNRPLNQLHCDPAVRYLLRTRITSGANMRVSPAVQDTPAAAAFQTQARTTIMTAVAPQAGKGTGSARLLVAQWTCVP